MPSDASFNYYEELEIEKTASQDQIKTAYHRLALLKHPDKNPDDKEATTAFQRLGTAYETLKDPRKRKAYDWSSGSSSPSDWDPNHGWSNFSSDDEYELFPGAFGFRPAGGFFTEAFFRAGQAGAFSRRAQESRSKPRSEEEKERRRQDEERAARAELLDHLERLERIQKIFQAEREEWTSQRRAVNAELKRLREIKKKADEAEAAVKKQQQAEAEAALKQQRQIEEKEKQEARWAAAGVADDEAARRATCLHSEFCAKVQHNKKFRCVACGAKRGMTAFECPHCDVSLCQLCVGESAKQRAKVDADQGHKVPGLFKAETPAETEMPAASTAARAAPKNSAAPTTTTTATPAPPTTASEATSAAPHPNAASKAKKAAPAGPDPNAARTAEKKSVRNGVRPSKKPSTAGPDPGYEGQRHVRCGFLHGGGDAACYVMHPERRPSRVRQP